ncbi:acetyltransferase-like protein [Roseobacter litoralis Och 149]|uniref:Acetyltransferase-like protein n=1 Tax=Roseobacter litoralis (strain ATCC 49566 / DSM 6996 / JCM 21268 / NBRC 15278 / OCh 149) TaxID=391595 RepID=F7ZD82_ROSLO|nr:acetyltransferase-like protein [Roseobacter litoralis Och 149]
MIGPDHLKHDASLKRRFIPVYTLTHETEQDHHEVEALYDLCFAPGREALSSYRLRDDVPPVENLSHVARDRDGILGGAIRYWPVRIGEVSALLLGPVAVHPTRQGEGLASLLIRSTLDLAAEAGWQRVMLVGDAPYYQRYQFTRLSDVNMPPPTNPDRVLGRALVPGAWDGVVGEVTRWRAD